MGGRIPIQQIVSIETPPQRHQGALLKISFDNAVLDVDDAHKPENSALLASLVAQLLKLGVELGQAVDELRARRHGLEGLRNERARLDGGKTLRERVLQRGNAPCEDGELACDICAVQVVCGVWFLICGQLV